MNKSLMIFTIMSILLIYSAINAQKKTETIQSKGTAVLGQLVGTWTAKGISRNADGTWKTDTTASTWIWYYILNGHAIQDDWYANAAYDSLENATLFGTNIRIYNQEERKWYMSWIDTRYKKTAYFTAVNSENKVIMEGTNSQEREIRNTFFNISENSFNWQQEWTFDKGKTWLVVSKIFCNRVR